MAGKQKNHFYRFLCALTFLPLLLAIACKPIDPKDNPDFTDPFAEKLTGEQQKSLETVLNGIGRIESAALIAKGQSSDASVADPLTIEMKNQMVANSCSIDYVNDSTNILKENSYLVIGGQTCSLTTDYKTIVTVEGGNQGKINLNSSFTITSKELGMKNDISSFSLEGLGNAISSEFESQENYQFTGKAVSITKGSISIRGRVSIKSKLANGLVSSNGIQNIQFSFPKTKTDPSYGIELQKKVLIQDGKDHSVYLQNKNQISAQEFNTFIHNFGIIFP